MSEWAGACWRGLALAFGAGAVAALGQAPFGLYPLTILGLGLGFALVLGASDPRRAASLAWALGTGYFALTFNWIVEPFLVDVVRHGWMAPFALVFLAGGLALFWGLAAWIAARLPAGPRWLVLAAMLSAAELLRGWIFTGFPWGGPGAVWVDTWLASLAAVIGVYGLSALSFAFAAALSTKRWLPLGAAAMLILAAGFTTDRLTPTPAPTDQTLRLIQINAPQHLKWERDHVMTFFERALALTRAAPEGAQPDLVIWPETSIPALLDQAPWMQAEAAAAAVPAPLIAGQQRRLGATYTNALVLFSADGTAAQTYDKHHLVPFGEYVPLGNLAGRLGIRGLAQREGFGYIPGPGPQLMDLPGGLGQVVPLICYEAIFPRDIAGAPGRADWLLQITNDAWFGNFSGPQQHLVQARFRAIEFGLPLARAANTGISAVIDAKGQVVAHLPLNEAGVLDVILPGTGAPTLYARVRDLPLILSILFAIIACVAWARAKGVDRESSGR